MEVVFVHRDQPWNDLGLFRRIILDWMVVNSCQPPLTRLSTGRIVGTTDCTVLFAVDRMSSVSRGHKRPVSRMTLRQRMPSLCIYDGCGGCWLRSGQVSGMADLAEFMENALRGRIRGDFPPFRGQRPVRRLADSGRASLAIARTIGDAGRAEQVLASVFWWCYVRTGPFEDLIRRSIPGAFMDRDTRSANPIRGRDVQLMVVAHDVATRYDLLVLGPAGTPSAAFSVSDLEQNLLRGSGSEIRSIARRNDELLQRRLALAGVNVHITAIADAVFEMSVRWPFGIVVGAQPEAILTSAMTVKSFIAPSPALSVTVPREPEMLATAGLIGGDHEGRVLVLTARHAVADPDQVRVAHWDARVRSSDEVTDSCVLEVSCAAGEWRGAGLAGLRKIAPVQHHEATFDGAASQHRETMIRSYDLSILDPDQYLASKVYTDPDTVPGDSGAALIDSDDCVVGFAVSRTAFGAPLEFSSWVWACQVLARHGLA